MQQAAEINTTHDAALKPHVAVAAIVSLFAIPAARAVMWPLPEFKPCPFCGSDPDTKRVVHRVGVFCNNDECAASPEVTGATMAEALERWPLMADHKAPTNVINLAERLECRLMASSQAANLPSMHHEMQGLSLSGELHHAFKNLICMADAARTGKAAPAMTGVALWRIAECLRDSAFEAERLEHKLRKAKKKARR